MPERRHIPPQRAVPQRPVSNVNNVRSNTVRRAPLNQPMQERPYSANPARDVRRPFGNPFQNRRPQQRPQAQQREPMYEQPQNPFMRRRRFRQR
jgi:hypothetical protein